MGKSSPSIPNLPTHEQLRNLDNNFNFEAGISAWTNQQIAIYEDRIKAYKAELDKLRQSQEPEIRVEDLPKRRIES